MDWNDEFVTLQIRIPRAFKNSFQDWCDSEGITMSAAIVTWIAQREAIGLPKEIKKPWRE